MEARLLQQLRFLREIDGMKNVWRQTRLVDDSRRENDAEHTWELVVMALTLEEYAPTGTDLLQVLRLLALHDIVEVDAGDTFAFDASGHRDKQTREAAAAERIFGLLPPDQADYFRSLWDEYEEQTTQEAQFALCIDRLQPFLHNIYTRGGTWSEHDIRREQVLQRNRPWAQHIPALWQLVQDWTDQAVKDGILKE